LRAISTSSGEVLASVVVRKPIASVADRGSIFRYVALDELLEAEAGIATNEPRQIAVEQAIEKAVMALIAEGSELGIWSFHNQEAGRRFVGNYRAQKYQGDVPETATTIRRPATQNAAQTVRTRPISRTAPAVQPVTERRLAPQVPTAPAAPPPALPPAGPQPGEAVG